MNLVVKEIPVGGAKHPNVPDFRLPMHEFTLGIIAPKGCGKTTFLINLIDFYKGYFERIIIFSPTIRHDEKWHYVKNGNYLAKNTRINAALERIRENRKRKYHKIVEQPTESQQDEPPESFVQKEYSPKIDAKDFHDEFDLDDIIKLMNTTHEMIEYLEANGETKHVLDRTLLVFDDMVGSTLYERKQKSPFKKLNTNHRHYSFSMLLVSQAYKEIQKTIRVNFTGLILFKICNEAELKSIYEEHPMGYSEKVWRKLYDVATAEPYSFMYINYFFPSGRQLWKKFESILFAVEDISL